MPNPAPRPAVALLMGALLAAVVAAPATAADASFPADAILGLWETEHEEAEARWSHVEVYAKDGKVHGRLVWLSHPVYEEGNPDGPVGQPVVDFKNPDEALRGRPILGMELMRDFEHNGQNKWEDGRIYDPESGKTYRAKLTLKDADTLELFGYVKVGFVKLGRDSIWKRIE
jgi:uncharacterized protein (DUF2147 family)